ncbi:hypothetical protein BH18ACI2_BH18ACI2_27480 [soil metagenome]
MKLNLKLRRLSPFVIAVLLAALFFFADPPATPAQCALCRAAATSLNEAGAKNLNLAVLLLLTPPVSIFCAFFYVAYKRRNAPGEDES